VQVPRYLADATDGAPRDGRDAATHGYWSIADYAFARRVELRAALGAGRAGGVGTEFIGIPDQEACLSLVTLTQRILRRLRQEASRRNLRVTLKGGHPDHDAVALSCRSPTD
jgi:N-acetylglucosamine malate deacetylase 2